MKKSFIIALIAVFPLMYSCSKEVSVEATEVETPEIQADPWTLIPMKMTPGTSGFHSLKAGTGEETKSQIAENAGHTYASVTWTAGDQFKMLGFDSGYTSYSEADYATTASGAIVDFTTGTDISAKDEFHSIYPLSAFYDASEYLGNLIFGVTIPALQTATPGNVDKDALVSYAQSTTQDEDLHFKNFVHLIKFRLAGSLVSEIGSVALHGIDFLAGDMVMSPNSSGEPELIREISFIGAVKTKTVTLNGSFVAGTDYYIAVAPGVTDSFSMVFTDSGGTKTKTLFSGKVLTMNRSRITDFGEIDLGDTFDTTPAPLSPYKGYHTKGTKPATIVVIPDGFKESELSDYEDYAKAGIEALFNTEPYKSYREYFNVWILKVASNESGASVTDGNGNITELHDCYFRSQWGASSYSDMSANTEKIFSFVEDHCPDILDGTHTIAEVPILMIINDSRYGGICHSFSNGSGYGQVPVTAGPLGWEYPDYEASSVSTSSEYHEVSDKATMGISTGTWLNTLVHEFGGHCFGRLGDEYWGLSYKSSTASLAQHSWPVPMSLNISVSPTTTPWDDFMNDTNVAALRSSNDKYGRIGVFQGGDVSLFNRWRSERTSCMIDNRFYFSAWQRYLIVKRIMSLAGETVPSFNNFLLHDVPDDPVRDGGGSPVIGVGTWVQPRIMPPLPEPVLHEDW